MKRTQWKRSITPTISQKATLRRTKLRKVSVSSSSVIKTQIQAVLRLIVILRDGGCFLRNYKNKIDHQYVNCGGWRKDNNLILQAEHLNSRSHMISFADSRLVVCVCQRHHFYYKPQHSAEYNELAKEHIGAKNSKLWEAVRNDKSAYKVDLKLELIALKTELKKLYKSYQKNGLNNQQDNIENVLDEVLKECKLLVKD